MKVHTAMGAGCCESTTTRVFDINLRQDGVRFDHQVRLPVVYDNVQVDALGTHRLLVENCVVVELKAVESAPSSHCASAHLSQAQWSRSWTADQFQRAASPERNQTHHAWV
jgi:GxxExxY protein